MKFLACWVAAVAAVVVAFSAASLASGTDWAPVMAGFLVVGVVVFDVALGRTRP